MRAILFKELSRLWLFLVFLFVALVLFFAWFSFELSYNLNAIHPEAVIWYEYNFFTGGVEEPTLWAVLGAFISVALAQFLTQKNRTKCLLHLPISRVKILLFHYAFAFMFFTFVWLIFGVWIWIFMGGFYPDVLVVLMVKNWCYYCLCGVLAYGLVSAILLDKNVIRAGIFSAIFITALVSVSIYFVSFWAVIFLIFVSLILGYNALISHKQTSLSALNVGVIISVILAICSVGVYKFYDLKFTNKSEKYYIFYSPSLKEFLFQQNLGGHYFAYRGVSGRVFDSETEYKNELGFNYFMDLKQQGKLPLVLDGKSFYESEIKSAKRSMSFSPASIVPPKIPLYPLFNPNPKISAIAFSEDMIYFGKNGIKIYHHAGEVDKKAQEFLNQKAVQLGVKFPIADVFGRFSNLKPFNAGLFIKDSKGEIFNIYAYDDELFFAQIPALNGFEYLHIDEVVNSDFLGLGFKNGEIFLLDKNYRTTKLEVDYFDFRTMRLRVSFDPLYLQVRFDDSKSYKAYVFDKFSLKLLDKTELK